MNNNQNIKESPKQPSITAQSNNSNNHSPDLHTFPIMNSYEHKIAMEIFFKITSRIHYRQFINNLTFTFILKLKQEKQQIKTIYVTSQIINNDHNINWPYCQLYYKKYRTNEEQQMMQFINLCATIIQSNFKGYITQKRHKLALNKYKKITNNLTNFIKIWKAKRIYNCRRCYQIKLKYRQIQTQIDLEYEKSKIDKKKLQLLDQYIQFNATTFRDTYYKLYKNGMWILQDNMKPMVRKIKKVTKQPVQILQQKFKQQYQQNVQQIKIKSQRRKRQFKKKKSQQIKNTYSINQNIQNIKNPIQQRPIVTKGEYIYNAEQQETIIKQQTKVKEEYIQNQQEKDNKKIIINSQKIVELEKFKKRQKYDPKKAIQEQKKKKQIVNNDKNDITTDNNTNKQVKKQINKAQNKKTNKNKQIIKTENSSIKKQQVISKKKIKINKNQKIQRKKVQSQVDCWVNNKKQCDKQWIKQIKQRLTKQMKQQQRQQQQLQLQQKNEQYYISEQRKKIIQKYKKAQILQKQQFQQKIKRYQSKQQLKNQVRQMVQRNNINKRKQVYRPVYQLQQTYNKHYGDRYQNLMPKLGLLSVARNSQHDSNIPVINSYSESFNLQLKDILVHAKFWQLATRMQKTFKQFIIE